MKIITTAKVKELLGSGAPDDAKIDQYIPIIDAKVKKITGQRYNDQIIGITKNGSPYVEVISITCAAYGTWDLSNGCRAGINNSWTVDTLQEYLEIGTLLEGEGIPADAYIDEAYYNGYSVELGGETKQIPTIKLSANATADNDSAQIFFGFNIGLQPTVAKGVNWLINQENTTNPSNPATSKRVGPANISYGSGTEKIDQVYGMPAWFIKAFQSEIHMSGY
jgi:hypothetical protein